MGYYLKQGQSSMLHYIKVKDAECQVSKPISKITKNKKEKIVQKMKKKGLEPIVISKEIKQDLEFMKILNNNDLIVFDGKWLMQYILQLIIKYLEKKTKKNDEITVLANELTDELVQNIRKFTDSYKKIKIVTNHLEKFKKVEEEILESCGMQLIITNNKRKALAKSELIVNFDFVQERINEYNVNENAIIVNLNGKIKINKKRFSRYYYK